MAGYVPWGFLYFALAFSIMYSPVWLQLPVLFGYVALYGALSYLWLKGGRLVRLCSALIVPLPVLLFVAFSEYHSTGNPGVALRWLTMLAIHAAGVFAAALLNMLHMRTLRRA
ncbi:MAG: hypothetical protein P8Y78_14275 [Acidihalobacter sp.]